MATKQYADHKSVPNKYKWDLSFLLEGKTPEEAIDSILKEMRKEIAIKDSKYDDAKTYLKYRKDSDKTREQLHKIHNYLSNSMSINIVDAEIKALAQKFDFESYKINQELGPEAPRFFSHAKELAKWAKLPEFKTYKLSIEDELDTKKHQLPKAIQEFRATESRADANMGSIFSILTNSEIDYGYATTSKGKKIKITLTNRVALTKHSDPMVRKTATIEYKKGVMSHRESLSDVLYQEMKKTATWSKLEKFPTVIDALIYEDKVDVKLITTLYDKTQEYMPAFRKADRVQKKFYKAKFGKAMTQYDGLVEILKSKGEYTPDDAIKLVNDAFKPFGKEYTDKVKEAFESNWVDFMPIKNKRGGAYSIGATYGIDKKLIEMNFDGTFESIETLAHEMGHSMHSYYSDKANDITNAAYPIFVAEIASIFNEMMLYDHVLSTTDDDKLKFQIRQAMAYGFNATVLEQIKQSNFEFEMYTRIGEGEPLSTYDAISKVYHENFKKYSIKKDPKYKAEDHYICVSRPHYYYEFYIYKYAIGQLVANVFFQKYKAEGPQVLKDYIENFLSAGCKQHPVDTLKSAGVDLHDPKTYELGFKGYTDNIEEWEKLGNKIFKLK